MTRVAIMQPYFIPYAGYFRLFAAADHFVIYDCVQFPRRGYVHRNRLRTRTGALAWLTLPLKKAPRDARIDALVFRADAQAAMHRQLASFAAVPSSRATVAAQPLWNMLTQLQTTTATTSAASFVAATLQQTCSLLQLPWQVSRSSDLNIPADIRGQERILAILESLQATTYINSPGGRGLYAAEAFKRRGVQLQFLEPYQGATASILQRLSDEPAEALTHDIRSQAQPKPA